MANLDKADSSDNKQEFPDHQDDPNKKAKKSWGLQVAKTIWTQSEYHDGLFYHNRDKYDELIEFALGRQDPNIAKPVTGINPESADQSFVRGIDWEPKNYATKRVNIAVSKIQARRVDPIATPISPHGNDIVGERKGKLKAFMENRDLMQNVAITTGTDLTPFGIPQEKLPRDNEELDIFMQMFDKPFVSMEMEKRIIHYATRANYDEKRSNMAWDGFVLGPICAWCGMGPNYNPTIKWLDPRKFIAPPSNDPFFNDAQYFGYVDDWPISRLLKYKDEFDETELSDIIENKVHNGKFDDDENVSDNKKQELVRILHFEYLTNNEKVFVKKEDSNGNRRFVTKRPDQLKTQEQIDQFRAKYGTTRQFIRPGFDVIYEGFWVVGTDYIFNWGVKKFSMKKNGNIGERMFGFKAIVPNMRSNTVVSNMGQMKVVLKELMRVNAKIQQLLASEIPDGFSIDIDALREAKLTLSNKALMSDMQLIDMVIQSGIHVYSGKSRIRGATDKPINTISNDKNAEKIAKLLILMQNSLRELDELIGFNEVSSAQALPKEKGARVSMLQNQATDSALDHLYSALHYMDREIYRSLAVLSVQATKYGDKKKINKIFGSALDKVVGEETDITKFDYGIDIQPQPTAEEWEELNFDVREALKNGQITISQRMIIKNIRNLKEAQAMLAVFEKRNREEAQKVAEANNKANSEAQLQSNEQTHNNAMDLKKIELSGEKEIKEADIQLEKLRHKNAMAELKEKIRLETEGKDQNIRTQGDEDVQKAMVESRLETDDQPVTD